jgi:PKD repeat protein
MFTAFMVSRLRRAIILAGISIAFIVPAVACQKVPLLAPTGSTITLTSSATTLPLNGSTDIIAQVIEAAGTPPHSGTHITFSTNLGSFQPSEAETDISGRVTVRFLAGTTSGTATITAISGGVSVPADKVIKILIGAAAVGSVSVGATPATLPSTGGTATITATVADTSGNLLPSVPVTFAIDTGSSGTAGGNGVLSATVVNTDANGRAQTALTTNRTTTVSATAGIATTSGTTTTAAQVSRVTVVVNTTTSISIGGPSPSAPQAGQTVTFPLTYGTSATASPVTRLSVDWGDGRTQSYTGQPAAISHMYLASGSFLVLVTGIDALGDTSTTSTSITVVPRPALVVTISANPAQPSANTVVTFTIAATPTTGQAITSVTIDFGDGQRGTITGNVGTAQHVYTTPAQYIVSVIATDSSGATGSATIVLVVGTFAPPTASFTVSPSSGPASTTFQFNGSDSTPPASIVTYAWDFGDGQTGTGHTTSHQYSPVTMNTTYTVRLTVTDTAGRTATTTKSVQVTFP